MHKPTHLVLSRAVHGSIGQAMAILAEFELTDSYPLVHFKVASVILNFAHEAKCRDTYYLRWLKFFLSFVNGFDNIIYMYHNLLVFCKAQ